jgi:hypothetical protein
MTSRHTRDLVRLSLAGGLIALVAACGGGSAATPAGAATKAPTTTSAPATTTPSTGGGSGSGTATGVDLAALTPAATITEVLGSSPTPECKTSAVFGGVSCVWTAGDGAWVKVEHSVAQETPDLASFTQRMTKTLGLGTPVEGIGQAAFMRTGSTGAKIATYLGDGLVVWVVINKKGDAATQTTQLQSMAKAILAGL